MSFRFNSQALIPLRLGFCLFLSPISVSCPPFSLCSSASRSQCEWNFLRRHHTLCYPPPSSCKPLSILPFTYQSPRHWWPSCNIPAYPLASHLLWTFFRLIPSLTIPGIVSCYIRDWYIHSLLWTLKHLMYKNILKYQIFRQQRGRGRVRCWPCSIILVLLSVFSLFRSSLLFRRVKFDFVSIFV